MKREALLTTGIAVVVVVGTVVGVYAWLTRPFEYTANSYASWSAGGSPGEIEVRITDAKRQPVSGAAVVATNNSGTTSPQRTNRKGFCRLQPGELDLMALDVDGNRVIDRPLAYWLNNPRIDRGLRVSITLFSHATPTDAAQ